jgi:trk system potassium uptake protein TrkH
LFWIGGLGIIVFTLMIASRSSSVVRGPYRLKGHLESFMPSVIEATFQMWKIYVVLTVLFLSPFLSSWQLV